MPIIKIKDLNFKIKDQTILNNINLEISKGEYLGLIGPNGAGKSSLIKCIIGINKNYDGKVTLSKDLKIAYVPQVYQLEQNVPISTYEVLTMSNKFEYNSEDILRLTGVDKLDLESNFHFLSGGQKQRVVIARALLNNPDILFFDEPFSGIDYETKNKLYELLSQLNKRLGITIVFVSHEIDHVVSKCDKVICLNKSIHTGCHPIDFVKGRVGCQDTHNSNIKAVHHHHNH